MVRVEVADRHANSMVSPVVRVNSPSSTQLVILRRVRKSLALAHILAPRKTDTTGHASVICVLYVRTAHGRMAPEQQAHDAHISFD
jgi:hypothetical protein